MDLSLLTLSIINSKNLSQTLNMFKYPFPALVAKLADALDSGSSAARHGGSNPLERIFICKELVAQDGLFP